MKSILYMCISLSVIGYTYSCERLYEEYLKKREALELQKKQEALEHIKKEKKLRGPETEDDIKNMIDDLNNQVKVLRNDLCTIKRRDHPERYRQIDSQCSPLIEAINEGACKKEIERLLKAGCDVNERDSNGRTALHWAILTKEYKVLVPLLITYGAYTTIADNDGNTPEDMTWDCKTQDEVERKKQLIRNYLDNKRKKSLVKEQKNKDV